MSDDFKKYFEEEPSPEHNQRVSRGAIAHLARNKKPFFSFLFSGMGLAALGTAGAVAVAFVLIQKRGSAPQGAPPAFAAYDQAMLQDVDLLLKLQVLQNMDTIEKAGKKKLWPKKKSS